MTITIPVRSGPPREVEAIATAGAWAVTPFQVPPWCLERVDRYAVTHVATGHSATPAWGGLSRWRALAVLGGIADRLSGPEWADLTDAAAITPEMTRAGLAAVAAALEATE